MLDEHISQIKQIIEDADAVLINAGAGIGVDSGLPDFRGDEGFWKAYPVIKDLGISFSQMANPKWFVNNPKLAWAFYGHRLHLYRDTIPHDGFKMLLDLVKKKGDDYFIYTSNVDGQFQKAGFSDEKIVEVHGSIHHFQCLEDCKMDIWDASDENVEIDMEKFEAKTIPLCKHCGGVARPNIMMFGDWDFNTNRTTKQENRFATWYGALKKAGKKLVIIEIGAGTAIPTIRDKGEHISKKYRDAQLIRINPREYLIKPKLGFSIPFGGLDGLTRVLL